MQSKVKFAMGLFVYSESVFFLVLIAAYAYFHVQPQTGPDAASSLHPGITGAYSVCLFASSATMATAHRFFRRDNHRAFAAWLLVTIILGAVFLYGQGSEYASLFAKNITVGRNLFSTTFFTLTGFHGLHVFIGLCLLAITLGLALRGRLAQRHALGLDTVSIYWHFVDAVWVFIFALVYLWALV